MPVWLPYAAAALLVLFVVPALAKPAAPGRDLGRVRLSAVLFEEGGIQYFSPAAIPFLRAVLGRHDLGGEAVLVPGSGGALEEVRAMQAAGKPVIGSVDLYKLGPVTTPRQVKEVQTRIRDEAKAGGRFAILPRGV